MKLDLNELPKKTQYVIIDSEMVNIVNGDFTLDLSLESNLHMEDMSKVIGFKLVDFYITNVGRNDAGFTNGAKFINIMCDDIPKRAQLLDEREGHVLARIALDRNFSGTANDIVVRDKQWQPHHRKTNYFNPISMQKLNFRLREYQADDDYIPLRAACYFYMIVEVTTIDVRQKPPDREVQMLQALTQLNKKIDELNANVVKIPTQKEMEEAQKKKYPFVYLMLCVFMLGAGYLFFTRQKNV